MKKEQEKNRDRSWLKHLVELLRALLDLVSSAGSTGGSTAGGGTSGTTVGSGDDGVGNTVSQIVSVMLHMVLR